MATPWDDPIKNTKQLTVFAGPDLTKAAAWGVTIFRRVLAEFNKLSTTNKLGVTLIESQAAPARSGPAGANVQIEVSTGTHKFFVDGKEQTRSLPASGFDIHCVTHPVTQGGVMLRAFIFVPISPSVQGQNSRGIGNGLKVVLALHEMLHACGLE